jgi:hypothetical protein
VVRHPERGDDDADPDPAELGGLHELVPALRGRSGCPPCSPRGSGGARGGASRHSFARGGHRQPESVR